MSHRADTPISQRLMTSLHSILDTTNLTIADIASMMGADRRVMRGLAYGRVQRMYFSGFVERLELTLSDIGTWIETNGHHGITHYVRNSYRKYSIQSMAKKKKANVQKKVKRFKTGAHFTGRVIAAKKADLQQAATDYVAQMKSTNDRLQTAIDESKERIKKHERVNTIINIFMIFDVILITALLAIMVVQALLA